MKLSLLSFVFLIFTATAKVVLPEMATKQDPSNLRFISFDGEFTYYQRGNGFLNLSSNYQVSTLIKGKKGSQYNVFSSPARKKIIVTHDATFHTHMGLRKEIDIYASSFGKNDIKLIGKGRSPKLHLDDSWISYYSSKNKFIKFQHLLLKNTHFKISISKDSLPYFVPTVLYLNNDEIIYTDQNKKGQIAVVHLNKKTKASQIILKSEGPFENIELCFNPSKKDLFIGRFSPLGSEIYHSSIQDIKQISSIYSSKQMDWGHLDCSEKDKLYFLKTENNRSDLYLLSIASKKLKRLSFMADVSNFINMDGKLIIPFRGKFYLVTGKNNLPYVDQLNSKEKGSK